MAAARLFLFILDTILDRWVAILQHRPAELHCDSEGRLHRDGGPVVRFRDGFAFWILHGVPVPKEIAETPGEQLDVNLVLTTQNADIRREILRKIGLEIHIHKIGAKLAESTFDGLQSPGSARAVSINIGRHVRVRLVASVFRTRAFCSFAFFVASIVFGIFADARDTSALAKSHRVR